MVRNVLAVLLAPIIWGLLNFAGNSVLLSWYPEVANGTTPLGYLLLALLFAQIYSLASGLASAMTAQAEFNRIGLYAGIALFIVGLSMQIAFWNALPVWYHLVFLALLIPVCMAGASFVKRQ